MSTNAQKEQMFAFLPRLFSFKAANRISASQHDAFRSHLDTWIGSGRSIDNYFYLSDEDLVGTIKKISGAP